MVDKKYFTVPRVDYERLADWFQWMPVEELTLLDKILGDKFWRGQVDPKREPGQDGHSYKLTEEEVRRVRNWFDWVADVVLDEPDEDYAERMDEFLARYA